ncbi:hypothetical protein LguiB_032945 [Lonicera macranthoides]
MGCVVANLAIAAPRPSIAQRAARANARAAVVVMLDPSLAPPSLIKCLNIAMMQGAKVDGQVHQMVYMHGGIDLLGKKEILRIIVLPKVGLMLLVKNIMAEDPFKCLTTTTMGKLEKPLDRVDLINNPDLVATDPTISFKTAIWFWMTPQANKPLSHNVITGRWNPSAADRSAGRLPGYGGGLECGKDLNDRVVSRVGFYKRYCDILGVSYGNNLDCYNQRPFA